MKCEKLRGWKWFFFPSTGSLLYSPIFLLLFAHFFRLMATDRICPGVEIEHDIPSEAKGAKGGVGAAAVFHCICFSPLPIGFCFLLFVLLPSYLCTSPSAQSLHMLLSLIQLLWILLFQHCHFSSLPAFISVHMYLSLVICILCICICWCKQLYFIWINSFQMCESAYQHYDSLHFRIRWGWIVELKWYFEVPRVKECKF